MRLGPGRALRQVSEHISSGFVSSPWECRLSCLMYPQILRPAEPAEWVSPNDGLCSPDSSVENNTAENDEAVYGGPQYKNSASLSVSTDKH